MVTVTDASRRRLPRRDSATSSRPSTGLLAAAAGLLLAAFCWAATAGPGLADAGSWERYTDLGRKALQAKNYSDAQAMFEAALLEAEQISPWDMRVGRSLNDLAATHYAQGQHPKVIEALNRSLRVMQVGFGPTHPDVAQVLRNLAAVEYLEQDYASAEAHLLQALEIWRSNFGEDHAVIATTLKNLAGVYEAQSRHAEAAETLQLALTIGERVVGPNHESLTETRRQLADLRRIHGLLPPPAPATAPAVASLPAASGGSLSPQVAAVTPAPEPAPEPPAAVLPPKIAPTQIAPTQIAPAQIATTQIAPATEFEPVQIAPATEFEPPSAPAQVATAQIAPAQIAPAQVAPAQAAPAARVAVPQVDAAADAPETIFLEPLPRSATVAPAPAPAPSPTPAETQTALVPLSEPVKITPITVLLASFRSHALAEDQRQLFLQAYGNVFAAARDVWIEEVQTGDRGNFYRIMAGPFADASKAQGFCSMVHGLQQDCIPQLQ